MRNTIVLIATLLLISANAYAEQKLYNITEDTIPDDSYRPVAGKEFLVAVKLVDVDVSNQEQPISSETIQFQTSVGSLSETELFTNIYGEAITWLTTSATADVSHSITASVKDKPEITAITIDVKNIALPQDAPTAEQLIQKVEENNDKIQDIKGDITVTSNAPWSSPIRQLKIWKKGDKQKVEEISPNPGVFILPETGIPPVLPVIVREIVAFNPIGNVYVLTSKENTQVNRFPYNLDFVDRPRGVIVKQDSYINENNNINKFSSKSDDFSDINNIWIFMKENRHVYQGIGNLTYSEEYLSSNIEVNTGIQDSIFQ